jgi:hypothetical protein
MNKCLHIFYVNNKDINIKEIKNSFRYSNKSSDIKNFQITILSIISDTNIKLYSRNSLLKWFSS